MFWCGPIFTKIEGPQPCVGILKTGLHPDSQQIHSSKETLLQGQQRTKMPYFEVKLSSKTTQGFASYYLHPVQGALGCAKLQRALLHCEESSLRTWGNEDMRTWGYEDVSIYEDTAKNLPDEATMRMWRRGERRCQQLFIFSQFMISPDLTITIWRWSFFTLCHTVEDIFCILSKSLVL